MNKRVFSAIGVLLAVLAIAMLVAIGGDGEAELRAHAAWESDLRGRGACVMW